MKKKTRCYMTNYKSEHSKMVAWAWDSLTAMCVGTHACLCDWLVLECQLFFTGICYKWNTLLSLYYILLVWHSVLCLIIDHTPIQLACLWPWSYGLNITIMIMQVVRSVDRWSTGQAREQSILDTYVDAIRNAEYFIYIEVLLLLLTLLLIWHCQAIVP